MAKSIIDRRGKIRTISRKPKPMVRLHWRKQKALAVKASRRRRMDREFHPPYTLEVEIQSEDGLSYFITETSLYSSPEFIITE